MEIQSNGDIPCLTLPGRLRVWREQGRHGFYRQGALSTDLGEFMILGEGIEDLACGLYDGDFQIAQLVPYRCRVNGKNRPMVRALLLNYRLGKRVMESEPQCHTVWVADGAGDSEPGFMAQFAAGFGRFAAGFIEGAQKSRRHSR